MITTNILVTILLHCARHRQKIIFVPPGEKKTKLQKPIALRSICFVCISVRELYLCMCKLWLNNDLNANRTHLVAIVCASSRQKETGRKTFAVQYTVNRRRTVVVGNKTDTEWLIYRTIKIHFKFFCPCFFFEVSSFWF